METGLPLRMDPVTGPDNDDLKKIAAALWAKGVENTIITLGGSGSAVVTADGIRVASLPTRRPQRTRRTYTH